MFSDRRATFRSDETVEREANLVRRWGKVSNHSQFNIINLIEGPLRKNLPFTLDINFTDPRLERIEAFVSFSKSTERASLYVRRSIWKLADAGQDLSRFILAHEIGHLKMHRHDSLGFSDPTTSVLKSLQEQERAEPQADKFADRLLVAEELLNGLSNSDEIAYIFAVPIDCAQRRFDFVEDKLRRSRAHQVGEACPKCANFTLVRNGICLKCDTCGGTMRCW